MVYILDGDSGERDEVLGLGRVGVVRWSFVRGGWIEDVQGRFRLGPRLAILQCPHCRYLVLDQSDNSFLDLKSAVVTR